MVGDCVEKCAVLRVNAVVIVCFFVAAFALHKDTVAAGDLIAGGEL